MASNEQLADRVALKSMRVLDAYLDSPARAKDADLARQARVAASYLSTYATMSQAENSAEALRHMRAKELAADTSGKYKRALLEGPKGRG